MKVTVTEEPAWRRVLEIEVPAEVVDRALDKVVVEYRKRMVMPGFRKGKVPEEIVRKRMGDDLENEVLRRILPEALEDAVREKELRPLGDPTITKLQFEPGQPLSFTATLEVLPQVEIKGYEGLKLTREQADIEGEQIDRVLDRLRDQNAELEEVDRSAQGNDVVVIRHREIDEGGQPVGDGEPVELSLTVGGEDTPESFSRELMGAVVGDMKKVPLPYPPDFPDPDLAGKTRLFHVTVVKVQEKVWPALEDEFARKVLGNEEATVDDLKTKIRLNLEVEARVASFRALEGNLVSRLIELNPFELPQGVVESTLDRIVEQARKENPNLPPDEESRIREQYRPGVERRYQLDILMDSVGRQEAIEITEEDLDREIASYAEKESKKPEQVRGELKRSDSLEKLREDLFRRRVMDRLVEKADVTVKKTGQTEGEENE